MRFVDTVKAALSEAQEAQRHYQKAAQILSGGPASFYFEKIEEYVNALFGQFAPFHTGDRVKLIKRPNTNNAWSISRHFLIPGALGTVKEMDYRDGQFIAAVVFDDESWIDDRTGMIHPAENKHTYSISEKLLMLDSSVPNHSEIQSKNQ